MLLSLLVYHLVFANDSVVKKKVIIDTDPVKNHHSDIDDLVAIIYAARMQGYEIITLTTVSPFPK
jgi:hypothetical protein